MPSKTVNVGSAVGLHARPAAIIAEAAGRPRRRGHPRRRRRRPRRRQLGAAHHDPRRRQGRRGRGQQRRPVGRRHHRGARREGPRRLTSYVVHARAARPHPGRAAQSLRVRPGTGDVAAGWSAGGTSRTPPARRPGGCGWDAVRAGAGAPLGVAPPAQVAVDGAHRDRLLHLAQHPGEELLPVVLVGDDVDGEVEAARTPPGTPRSAAARPTTPPAGDGSGCPRRSRPPAPSSSSSARRRPGRTRRPPAPAAAPGRPG